MMRRSLSVCLLAAAALAAQANDGLELAAKSKSSASLSSMKSASVPAPFVAGVADPAVEAMLRTEPKAARLRSACDRATLDVCYDATEGRIVYKPARQYMPRFEGLKAESVSLRHDRVVFKYSFK